MLLEKVVERMRGALYPPWGARPPVRRYSGAPKGRVKGPPQT